MLFQYLNQSQIFWSVTCLKGHNKKVTKVSAQSSFESAHLANNKFARMASNVDWPTILKDRHTTFKVEENAFLESLKIANSNEVAAERIYQAIKDDPEIPENLKIIYREAVYGTMEKVKTRVRNRIGNIRRHLK